MATEVSSLTVKVDTTQLSTAINRAKSTKGSMEDLDKTMEKIANAQMKLANKVDNALIRSHQLQVSQAQKAANYLIQTEVNKEKAILRARKAEEARLQAIERAAAREIAAAQRVAAATERESARIQRAKDREAAASRRAAQQAASSGGSGGDGIRARLGGMSNMGPVSAGALFSVPSNIAIPLAAIAAGVTAFTALGAAITSVGEKIIKVSMDFERIRNILAVGAGFGQVGAEMEYIRSVADKMGLNFLSAADGYVKLSAAAKGTRLEGQGVKAVFEAISKVGAVMRFSTGDMSLSLLALQQMISKGKVSAEELRRQLAQRIPGGMKIAADAMGMTTDAFQKALKAGAVYSDVFLPKFAAQLEKVFGAGAEEAANSLQANFNRLETAVQSFWLSMDNFGLNQGLKNAIKGIASGINEISEAIGKLALTEGADQLRASVETLGTAIGMLAKDFGKFIGQQITPAEAIVVTLATGVYALAAAFAAAGSAAEMAFHGVSALGLALAGVAAAQSQNWDMAGKFLTAAKESGNKASEAYANVGTRLKEIKSNYDGLMSAMQQRRNFVGPMPQTGIPQGQGEEDREVAAGKRTGVGAFIQQMKEKIAALQEGAQAEAEVHLASLKGTAAEKKLADELIDKLYQLKAAKLSEKAAQDEKAVSDAAGIRHLNKLVATQDEFKRAMDKEENGVLKLMELRKEGQRMVDTEQISKEQLEKTMARLALTYDKTAAAAARHQTEIEKAVNAANARHSELEGYRKEIALLQEGLSNGTAKDTQAIYARILELKRKVSPVLDGLANIFEQIGDRITDSLVEMAFTGKASFGDLVQFMLKEIAKLLLYQNIIKPLLSMGGSGGGWMGTLATVLGGAASSSGSGGGTTSWGDPGGSGAGNWGSLSGSSPAPSAGGFVAPVSPGATNIEVKIESSGKASSSVQSQGGVEIAQQLKSAIDQRIIEMSRPGGVIHKVVYG